MLSLSLGRDGLVEAAAPAPRIECALLRCAAFVAVQLFLCLEVAAHWRTPSVDGNCCTYAWGSLLNRVMQW